MATKTFSEKMKQLEEISQKFESGHFDLEKDLSLYQEGVALAKELQKRLSEIRSQIQEIEKEQQ